MLSQTAIPAAEFAHLGRYRLRAGKEAADLSEERRQRASTAGEQRARVQRAQQGIKLLEKMREKRFEEHTALMVRELDEMAAEAYLSRWTQTRRAENVKRESERARVASGI
jgi:hypothetical protein